MTFTSAGLRGVPSRVPDPVPLGADGLPYPPLCRCMAGILTEEAYDNERHYSGDPGCSYAKEEPEEWVYCDHPDCHGHNQIEGVTLSCPKETT